MEQYLTLLYVMCCTLGQGVKNGFRFSEQEASNFKSKSEVIGFML